MNQQIPPEVFRELERLGQLKNFEALGILKDTQINKHLDQIISNDQRIIRLKRLTTLLAHREDSVLICGESGTGKETFARALHGCRQGRFIPINSTSLPDYLLESELFGHVKGAFTGAIGDKLGLFESAAGGTIFLDEIGDMPSHLQSKLLRCLQDKTIRRVGDTDIRPISCRFVFATHRNLDRLVSVWNSTSGRRGFRPDLYWRIAQFVMEIPPLRTRPEDIREILDARFDPKHLLSEDEIESLEQLTLEGNYRELEMRVNRLLIEKELGNE